MAKRNATGAGADLRRPFKGQPAVTDLTSNGTVIVSAVAPKTANTDTTPVRCGSMKDVVEQFEPSLSFQLKVLQKTEDGKVEPVLSDCVMEYGAKVPANAVADFAAENLIGKVRRADAKADEPVIETRPLLKQRLVALALGEIAKVAEKPEFAKLWARGPEAVTAWLDEQIAQVSDLIERERNRKAVTDAS